MATAPNIERLLLEEQERDQTSRRPVFETIDEQRYRLKAGAITIEVDRLRRVRDELVGELSVWVNDQSLSIADFYLSSLRARSERARLLAQRCREKVDWLGLLETFCQRVIAAERAGEAAVDLRTVPLPTSEPGISIEGLYLLRNHATIIFGDGGTAKSYLGLYLAGRLAEEGLRVGFFDWELGAEDHRVRLGKLFPDGMPLVTYARCKLPLFHEVDRLRRIARENRLDYAVYDSVSFACDGPPESAEVANRYTRATRLIGIGSLHTAHISKAEGGDQKPFGSTFWFNGARAVWYADRAEEVPDGSIIRVGLFNRKINLGALKQPVGFTVTFTEERTIFRRSNVADSPELSKKLSVRQRMIAALKRGALAPEAVAEEIEADLETVKRTVRRYSKIFIVLSDSKVGLLENLA